MLLWRTINIFVSSTFLDLQVERDYLSRYLVPELNESLRSRCIRVNLIDLRSGLNTRDCSESEKEERVLEVCIQEIHNSKPYFIGIIGGRYGWVPGVALMKRAQKFLTDKERKQLSSKMLRKSVTELEMLVGMLRDRELLQHSFVCIKDESSFNGIPEDLLRDYVDPDGGRKIRELRDTIIREFKEEGLYESNVIPFHGVWGGDQFVELPGLIKKLSNSLLNDICEWDNTVFRPNNVYEEEVLRKEMLISHLAEKFCGRESLLDAEKAFLLRNTSIVKASSEFKGHCLVGFSGCGKSSVFSKLCEYFAGKQEPKLVVLSHAAGVSLRSVNFKHMIDGWNYQLSCLLGLDYQDTYRPTKEFVLLCRRAQIWGYRIIILIDSMDSFIPETLPPSFDFIPLGIPFVCTSLPEVADRLFTDKTRYKIIDIGDFTETDADSLITKALGYKDIPDAKLLKRIIRADGRPAYISPLWLSMAVMRILGLDARDYAVINKKEDRSIADIVCSLPSEADELFQLLLTYSFRYFDETTVLPAISIMACSHYGVTESELKGILGDSWDLLAFSRARQYFNEFISSNKIDRRLSFTHNILKVVILNLSPHTVSSVHEKYLSYLLSQIRNSTDWSLIKDYQNEALFQILMLDDITNLSRVNECSSSFADSLWAVYSESPKRIVSMMKQYIDREGLKSIPLVAGFIKVSEDHAHTGEDKDLEINGDMLMLSNWLIRQVLDSLNDGQSGRQVPVNYEFFDYFAFPISYYSSTNDIRSLNNVLDDLKESFRLLKKNDGPAFYEGNYDSFFTCWCSTFHSFIRSDGYFHKYEHYKKEFERFVSSLSDYLVVKILNVNCPMDSISLFETLEFELKQGCGHLYGDNGNDAFAFYSQAQKSILMVIRTFQKQHLENFYYYEKLNSLAGLLLSQYEERFSGDSDSLARAKGQKDYLLLKLFLKFNNKNHSNE